jgi:hypothetical protein
MPKGTSTTLPLVHRPKTTGKQVELYPYLGTISRLLKNGQYEATWRSDAASQLNATTSRVNGRHLKPVVSNRPDFLPSIAEPEEDPNYLLRIEMVKYTLHRVRDRNKYTIFLSMDNSEQD